jgi:deferrochelatase/peroxidase EfeB
MSRCPFASRRAFLGAAAGLVAAARTAGAAGTVPVSPSAVEPFHGEHQGGILTPIQRHTYFAAFDLTTAKLSDVVSMLKAWTQASARLTAGETAAPLSDRNGPAADGGAALGLGASRLTLTFGFGAGLFSKDGKDRYGLSSRRPEALVELPVFHGDQLVEGRTGGDLSVQACADDPQVAFHAVRELVRLAYGVADLRWTQSGFISAPDSGGTPRNLMGFKDGTRNPPATPQNDGRACLDDVVWAGNEGPAWMRGGTYLVARRIRISLEHWDRTEVDFQEQVFGRHKMSGAPLGGRDEFEAPNLSAMDEEGNPVIPEDAHIRLGAAETNGGAQILRRAYSYNDGVSFIAERWPPWRQGMQYDAGLFFLAYQRDPRTGFIQIYANMAMLDALNQFTTHVGSGLFACPPGVREGEFIGQKLFDAA